MTRHIHTPKSGALGKIALIALVVTVIAIALLLKGTDVVLLNPKGLIAGEQHYLFLFTAAVLFLIGLPTLFLFYFFAWKYRETNNKAAYEPHAKYGKGYIIAAWAIPSVFMVVLSVVMWVSTHELEPQKAIASDKKPITIQVVAMRWKWLFIYPEQKIATVNFVQIPTDTPVEFELTADEAPMSSFWIPHLAGQLYAMTGHINKLNLMAEKPGDYPGSSAEINGAGFAGMKFIARASSQATYDSWVQDVRQNSPPLDTAGYEDLLRPSENNLVALYTVADSNLYDKVVMKYMGSHDHQPEQYHTEHE